MGKADKIILAIIALVALVSMGIFLLMWQNKRRVQQHWFPSTGNRSWNLSSNRRRTGRSTFQNMEFRLCWKSRTIRSGFYPQTVPTICVWALDGSIMNRKVRSVCQTVWQSRLLENRKKHSSKDECFFSCYAVFAGILRMSSQQKLRIIAATTRKIPDTINGWDEG